MLEFVLQAAEAMFPIIALVALGSFLSRAGWFDAVSGALIARLVTVISLPCSIFIGLTQNFTAEKLAALLPDTVLPVASMLLAMVVGGAAARFLDIRPGRRGAFQVNYFISNTMFIGLPMSTQLFGEVSVPYVMMYYMGSTVFTQTVAVLLIERAGTAAPAAHSAAGWIKDLITKPPILGVIAAMSMLFLDVRPPQLFMSFARYMSGCVTPLALMYCGFVVWEIGLKNIRLERGIPAMLFIRLIAAPAVCAAMCYLAGIDGLCRNVFIVEAALPVVTQITVMAGAYGADEEYAASGSLLSMLGIFITMPVLMMILT